MPSVPRVSDLRQKVRGWLSREPKPVVPRSILIVDSNPERRGSTAQLVERLGFEAMQTTAVADAMKVLDEQDPEFVLLDVELQDMSALDALAQIRAVDAAIPVVMLAPNLWDSRVAEAMRRGAVAYLAAPFGIDDLRELLGRR